MLHERFINLYGDKEKKGKKWWTFFLLAFWVKKDLDPDPEPDPDSLKKLDPDPDSSNPDPDSSNPDPQLWQKI